MPQEDFLKDTLEKRERQSALRVLKQPTGMTDFCSNDYLGLARNAVFQSAISADIASLQLSHGSTGSRLISGQHPLFEETENTLARFHDAEAALIFNSGYDANVGLFSAVPGRGDRVLYDNLIHASVRDGIRLSPAEAFSFEHNQPDALEKRLKRPTRRCFVVVEGVYSMDGDQAPLREITEICEKYQAHLIVDEAHATGVIGIRGEGSVQALGLQSRCFARIHTFGKALGIHGAAVVGSGLLKKYLLNYARSFMYTTALPPASIAAIRKAYAFFPHMETERQQLQQRIDTFRQASLPFESIPSATPIQAVLLPGNAQARAMADALQRQSLDVRAILHPTVPQGKERLRIVLHSFNTAAELEKLIDALGQKA